MGRDTTSGDRRRAAVILRRDLRLEDHTALRRAAEEHDEVACCFVFDPRQTDPDANEYFSPNAFQFLLASLDELDQRLGERGARLHRFVGDPAEVAARLVEEAEVETVLVHHDYTPFSKRRDEALAAAVEEAGGRFSAHHDALLHVPGEVCTNSGGFYKVFTPFMNKARDTVDVPEPAGVPEVDFVAEELPGERGPEVHDELFDAPGNEHLFRRGGRSEALEILERMETFEGYEDEREIPADEDGTTGLSAHHKFGTVSVRETFHRVAEVLGDDHGLITELYWRDFYTQLAHHRPEVFGHAFKPQYDDIPWENDEEHFEAWCAGRTGVPIVDAGMRQLATTGWMHNRVRMIVASYLTKDLHIDWRRGERWFARHLVDYDPAVNNGSWQWAASTGADSQPYFRIFNPWRQAERYDPEGRYIRRWVPELAQVPAERLHGLETSRGGLDGYPPPRVDHKTRSQRAEEMFREAKERHG